MEFASDLGKLQRLMASSSAGISRRQAILETLSISAGDQIMDVGCGGGHLLEHLAKAVGEKGHVYGVDPSEDQIAQARDRCSEFKNVTLLNSYADDISLEQNSCNSVTSTQAFEYIKDIFDKELNGKSATFSPSKFKTKFFVFVVFPIIEKSKPHLVKIFFATSSFPELSIKSILS